MIPERKGRVGMTMKGATAERSGCEVWLFHFQEIGAAHKDNLIYSENNPHL